MQDHILIVDDDRQLTSFLERFLAKQGFRATSAGSGEQMRMAMARHEFSLIILDLILPDVDGFEMAREVRRDNRVPMIMLSARDEVYDRIIGLELGADDYLTKPYEPRELLARIRSVLRRSKPADAELAGALPPVRFLRFGDLTLDLVERRLTRDGGAEDVYLTSTEFALLRALAQGAGEVQTRERILETVYGNAVSITDRAIDAHIVRLRRKIDNGDAADSMIRTVHGSGYLLAAEVEAAQGDGTSQ
ncbi:MULTISPECIES: response regulator [Actibacterium]|uniref:DNA-binding response OmpR family regulator n=1 Tax=Actibacterium naphthalenivorans TaxID=1614693 RepID=A0A840CC55_9RHOB|nr:MULTISPECIES: response regulator transcription factor [Actibacterium]ALG91339.1 hypothetical protein TQ29_15500 [Actibacterium sp. EMB200-NS6]MBB4022740.1 DNA-binding response OmpR family regulator [Actibacterium naphthalenivorans]